MWGGEEGQGKMKKGRKKWIFIIQNFGPNLARLRIEKGVSQTQLAED